MSDCLVYWKWFWTEFKANPRALNNEWYTKNENLLNQVEPGDSLWVVVSGGADYPNEWRLLQRIQVQQVKEEDEDSELPYHAVGNPRKSEKFDIRAQPDFTPILRQLEFTSGKKIKAKGKLIGRTIQTVRPLSDDDVVLLKQYAKSLKRLKT